MTKIYNSLSQKSQRLKTIKQVAFWLSVGLFYKVIFSIVGEYGSYFPADFESGFLSGRETHFFGMYRLSFYIHIISGPIALLIASFLMFSGKRLTLRSWHRRFGKALVYLVLLLMLPSGMVMATRAFTGPIAGIGFFSLSIFTAGSVAMASWHASQQRIANHRLWATRSFILLCSPLLLRLITGATIVLEIDNEWTYRFAAWASWLIPLTVFEIRKWADEQTIKKLGFEGAR